MSNNIFISEKIKKFKESITKNKKIESKNEYDVEKIHEELDGNFGKKMEKARQVCLAAGLKQSKTINSIFYFDGPAKGWIYLFCGAYSDCNPIGIITGDYEFHCLLSSNGFYLSEDDPHCMIRFSENDAEEILRELNEALKYQ